jgi:hypothetical protein
MNKRSWGLRGLRYKPGSSQQWQVCGRLVMKDFRADDGILPAIEEDTD